MNISKVFVSGDLSEGGKKLRKGNLRKLGGQFS